MERRVKLLVGGVGIVVLLAILATTTMGSTAEFVNPTELAETDEYDDEIVQLEGRVVDLETGDELTFGVADANYTTPVTYDGEKPETMSEGREVVAEGHFDGEELEASDLTIRAHEGEHPGDHPDGDEASDDYEYDEYDDYDKPTTADE